MMNRIWLPIISYLLSFVLTSAPLHAEVVTIDVTVKAVDASARSITITKSSKA